MISVCIATYNGEKYIRQQLESILKQLSESDEIIVSDDMSTDGTLDVIRSLNDDRIKIINHEKARARFKIDYATCNFENALKHAKGDMIFLSDQDDVWCGNKVKVMTDALLDSDIVLSDCYISDKNLKIVSSSYYRTQRVFKPSILFNVYKPSFLGSCMAFKRKVLERALPFPATGVGHDLWLGLVGLRLYKFSFIDMPLIYYRRHDLSVTDGGKENNTSLLFKIRYRLYILNSLVRLFFMRKY